MASPSFAPKPLSQNRLSLAEIDAVVSAKLGTTRTPGNAQPASFNRQVAMYLAARIGRWSTTEIGRFYNGRDHSTVCYGIQRIESLRESNPEVDAVLTQLKQQLANDGANKQSRMTAASRTPAARESGLRKSLTELPNGSGCIWKLV
jgi:DnaA-like protein